MEYFPLFVSLNGKEVKFFGAGNITFRRVKTLLQFDANIEIIAPQIKDELFSICKNIKIKEYEQGDCTGADLVIAATNNRDVNEAIANECKLHNIPVSVASDKTLCTFFFPSVIKHEDIVIGLTSSGKDHKKVKLIADKIRGLVFGETDY